AIQQRRHQIVASSQCRQKCAHLRLGQHYWQFPLPRGAIESGQIADGLCQKFNLQKDNGVQSQCLGARRDLSLRSQIGQKLFDIFIAQPRRVLFVVEQNKKFDPVQIGIDRAPAVALRTHEIVDGLEKGGSCHGQHLILEMPLTIYTFWWSGCRDRIPFNEDRNSGRKFYCIENSNIGSSEISGACPKGMLSNIVKEVIFTSLTGCYEFPREQQ